MKSDQKGVTLVELLAALALVGLVAGIAWTALSVGMQHNALEMSKTQLQQEANLVMTTLANEHRRSDSYYLRTQNGQLQIKSCSTDECGDAVFENISKSELVICGLINNKWIESNTEDCQDIASENGNLNETSSSGLPNWDESCRIEPDKEHVRVKLTIAASEKLSNRVSLNTTLTRILTGEKEGGVTGGTCTQ